MKTNKANSGLALLLTFVIVVPTLLSGCISKPEMSYVKNEWGEVGSSYTEIITKVGVNNPLPISLPVKDIKTEIYMNGIKMGQGSAIKADIRANSESEVIISTKIDNEKIVDWWVTHIKNGEETNVDVKGKLILDIFGITQFEYPLDFKSQIKTDILDAIGFKEAKGFSGFFIDEVKSEWGDVNKDYTEIKTNVKFKVNLPIHIVKFRYSIELNGIQIAEGVENVDKTIKTSQNVVFVSYIDNSKIPEWWVSHIKNGEKTNGKVIIEPTIEISGKEFEIPLIKQSFTFETNMLGGLNG
jgi:LEA14-like dessication related protein